MKVKAIWNRDKYAPKSRTIFILTDEGCFGEFRPEEKYKGRDEQDNIIWEDTGNCEFWEEESLIGDKWDIKQANFFIRYFGGELEWREEVK